MRNTNATRTNGLSPADEGNKDALVDEVVEAFGAMRGRGMRGIQDVRRGTLSVGHLQVLVRLQLGGPVPVRRVAEWLGVSAAGATGMVGRMEERGLVERVRDERDRRVVLVRVAAAGSDLLDEIGSRGRASLRRVLVRLDGSELRQLRNGLVAFQRAARELAEDERAEAASAADARGRDERRPRPGVDTEGRGPAGKSASEVSGAAEDPD